MDGIGIGIGIEIDRARGHERARVAAFYGGVGYGGGVAPGDVVFVARQGERIVGAVRLCDEAGVVVLRGMHVEPAMQGRGIGRALLMRCMPVLDRGAAFCLPYAHLTGFYGMAGFVTVESDALPDLLARRLRGYLEGGQDVMAMRRLASPLPSTR